MFYFKILNKKIIINKYEIIRSLRNINYFNYRYYHNVNVKKNIKKFQKVIGNSRKVDIYFKKSDILLSLNDFSEIIKNISKNFIINKLDFQDCKLDYKKYNIIFNLS
jgi:hypothetical protein